MKFIAAILQLRSAQKILSLSIFIKRRVIVTWNYLNVVAHVALPALIDKRHEWIDITSAFLTSWNFVGFEIDFWVFSFL